MIKLTTWIQSKTSTKLASVFFLSNSTSTVDHQENQPRLMRFLFMQSKDTTEYITFYMSNNKIGKESG